VSRAPVIAVCRALFAALGLVAIAVQMVDLADKGILTTRNSPPET
jgi:hypothetical protein